MSRLNLSLDTVPRHLSKDMLLAAWSVDKNLESMLALGGASVRLALHVDLLKDLIAHRLPETDAELASLTRHSADRGE